MYLPDVLSSTGKSQFVKSVSALQLRNSPLPSIILTNAFANLSLGAKRHHEKLNNSPFWKYADKNNGAIP